VDGSEEEKIFFSQPEFETWTVQPADDWYID
jgi:hypothetical protein